MAKAKKKKPTRKPPKKAAKKEVELKRTRGGAASSCRGPCDGSVCKTSGTLRRSIIANPMPRRRFQKY